MGGACVWFVCMCGVCVIVVYCTLCIIYMDGWHCLKLTGFLGYVRCAKRCGYITVFLEYFLVIIPIVAREGVVKKFIMVTMGSPNVR